MFIQKLLFLVTSLSTLVNNGGFLLNKNASESELESRNSQTIENAYGNETISVIGTINAVSYSEVTSPYILDYNPDLGIYYIDLFLSEGDFFLLHVESRQNFIHFPEENYEYATQILLGSKITKKLTGVRKYFEINYSSMYRICVDKRVTDCSTLKECWNDHFNSSIRLIGDSSKQLFVFLDDFSMCDFNVYMDSNVNSTIKQYGSNGMTVNKQPRFFFKKNENFTSYGSFLALEYDPIFSNHVVLNTSKEGITKTLDLILDDKTCYSIDGIKLSNDYFEACEFLCDFYSEFIHRTNETQDYLSYNLIDYETSKQLMKKFNELSDESKNNLNRVIVESFDEGNFNTVYLQEIITELNKKANDKRPIWRSIIVLLIAIMVYVFILFFTLVSKKDNFAISTRNKKKIYSIKI